MRHRIASLSPCALLLLIAAAPSPAQDQEPLLPPAPPAMRDFQLKPDSEPAPTQAAPIEAEPKAGPMAAAPAPSPSPPSPRPAAAPAEDGEIPWLPIGAAALALLGGLALLASRRRGAVAEPEQELAEETVAPVTPPAPRPRLTLEFKPLMAGSTEDQAAVQFELIVRNVGNTVARNVRIAIRMINASPRQDEELAAFFRDPIATADERPLTIPPGGRAETRRTAVLPKDAVQAINFQGKTLFIPVLAFNTLYEWGDGEQGQTATSFVVGRETNPPAEKMAPFRLDLGPRIYRTVGQRRNAPELVA